MQLNLNTVKETVLKNVRSVDLTQFSLILILMTVYFAKTSKVTRTVTMEMDVWRYVETRFSKDMNNVMMVI